MKLLREKPVITKNSLMIKLKKITISVTIVPSQKGLKESHTKSAILIFSQVQRKMDLDHTFYFQTAPVLWYPLEKWCEASLARLSSLF